MQKTLFGKLGSSNILLAIYLFALVVMAPFSSPSQFSSMSQADWWIMLFCCINTVVAYGAFTQSLRYWQTVQVSAVLAVVPVLVFLLTELCIVFGLWRNIIEKTDVDSLSIFGMLVVVSAAIGVQLVSARKIRQERSYRPHGDKESKA